MATTYTEANLESGKYALHPELREKLLAFRQARGFDVNKWIDEKTDMFNDYMRKSGLKACSVSVSGGIDSAVTLALMAAAAKKPNSPIQKVVGVAQPIHSTETIWKRALELKDAFNVEIFCVDQSSLHDQLKSTVDKAVGVDGAAFASGQLRSYMRTPVNYYVAQLISQQGLPCVVMGTGNHDEDGYLLYYCKAGDGVVDVQLIADLHKNEVFEVGRALKVPESILVAPPSADLWDGQTDEDELGISYDFVELYIEYLQLPEGERRDFRAGLSAEALTVFNDSAAKADAVHRRNRHKLNSPLNLNIMPTLDIA